MRNFNLPPGVTWRDIEGPETLCEFCGQPIYDTAYIKHKFCYDEYYHPGCAPVSTDDELDGLEEVNL